MPYGLRHLLLAAIAGLLLAAGDLDGQSVVSAQPGLCHHVEGLVFLNRDHLDPRQDGRRHAAAGDQLRTHRGFAELMLGGTTVLRSGGISLVRFDVLEMGRVELELLGGSLIADLADERGRETVVIRVRDSIVELSKLGVYRIDLGESPALRVFQGSAKVAQAGGNVRVKRGRRLALEPGAKPGAFDADRGDRFDLWASNRRIELVQELLAGMPDDAEPKRRAVNDPLESLRSIRRQTEAEIRSSAAADSLWVK